MTFKIKYALGGLQSQKTFLPLFVLVFTVYKRFKIGNSKKGDFINRLSTFIKCLWWLKMGVYFIKINTSTWFFHNFLCDVSVILLWQSKKRLLQKPWKTFFDFCKPLAVEILIFDKFDWHFVFWQLPLFLIDLNFDGCGCF